MVVGFMFGVSCERQSLSYMFAGVYFLWSRSAGQTSCIGRRTIVVFLSFISIVGPLYETFPFDVVTQQSILCKLVLFVVRV